ncbi:MucR family transcriptional regulator [Magnetofaba australis]|nr:MucR family transcriptional regulator [Magnetofaba australis]
MSSDLMKATAGIVESYVRNNPLGADDVPQLIQEVYASLSQLDPRLLESADEDTSELDAWAQDLAQGRRPSPISLKRPAPAVAVEESLSKDSITCLICGKVCKALKGHLTRTHKISVSDYRAMFDLPRDYPMVAPNYSAKRRQLAQDTGLGEKLRASRERLDELSE